MILQDEASQTHVLVRVPHVDRHGPLSFQPALHEPALRTRARPAGRGTVRHDEGSLLPGVTAALRRLRQQTVIGIEVVDVVRRDDLVRREHGRRRRFASQDVERQAN